MSRKPTNIVTRLEEMSKDESLPLAVREDAGKELLRLTLKDKPAAPPAPSYSTPVHSTEEMPMSMAEAFAKMSAEIEATKPKPIEPVQESAESRGPEPIEEEKPKPQPYIWRDERGRSTEDIKNQMWAEKRADSQAWARSMGLGTTRPEFGDL